GVACTQLLVSAVWSETSPSTALRRATRVGGSVATVPAAESDVAGVAVPCEQAPSTARTAAASASDPYGRDGRVCLRINPPEGRGSNAQAKEGRSQRSGARSVGGVMPGWGMAQRLPTGIGGARIGGVGTRRQCFGE